MRARTVLSTILHDPARTFLFLSLTIGVGYLVATPPLRVPDEASHFRRIVEIASGGLRGGAPIPESVDWLSRQGRSRAKDETRQTQAPYSFALWRTLAARPLDPTLTVQRAGDRAALFSPAPYLPALAAVALGMRLAVRPLLLLYLARATLLMSGILLLALAIRTAPLLQWPLCLIALFPTTTFLRSGVSADTLTIAFVYLLFAWVLRLRARDAAPRAGELAVLALLASAVALAKTAYLPLVLVSLVLPRSRFTGPRQYVAMLAACIVLPSVAGALWIATTSDGLAQSALGRADPAQQIAFVVHHPLQLAAALGSWLQPGLLVRNSLAGRILPTDLRVPLTLIVVGWGSVGLLVLLTRRSLTPTPAARVLFAGAALACVLAISLGAYVQWSPVASPVIRGLQLRYLLPLVPFALLATSPPRGWNRTALDARAGVIVASFALASNVWGIVAIVLSTWSASA